MNVGLLTISDRASRGERKDETGPVLLAMAERFGWRAVEQAVVPDEAEAIGGTLRAWCDGGAVDLVLTAGGTGFGPRDRTPEVTREVCDRMAPGLAEAMRAASLQVTPYAMLSRAAAGIRGSTLIVNLPGSPKAARENLEVIRKALPHAAELLRDEGDDGDHGPPGPKA